MIHVAYDERLLGWRLGKGHPTNPIRAKKTLENLERIGMAMDVRRVGPTVRTRALLEQTHSARYVAETLEGRNAEWEGERPDLGNVATLMFQATVDLVNAIDVSDVNGLYFSPQGAKHHAQWAEGSGFCVFNDMAWAAQHFARQGERVLYVDLDAHHGDGVENLTYGITDIMTASIHDATIFPGTGHADNWRTNVFNRPLPAGSGDEELVTSLEDVLRRAHRFDPTVVLVAVGGDGHRLDPLSTLEYSYGGYRRAGELLGEFAGERGASVLVGGAGGYRPRDVTPRCWSTFMQALERVYTGGEV